ncbi:MAG TPA: hypothetical protein VM866_06650 [Pyrinomonadaceae bacterium]|nr:hypothetical protein [Pyrinomonadaceae bacterium]
MERRTFFISLANFTALLTPQSLTVSQAATAQELKLPEISGDIRALEDYVKKHTEPFPWTEHNELRHLYGEISEEKSMQHADTILANSFMDDYILNILSDWQLEEYPGRAVVSLLTKTERHPSLPHLRAACLMKAGDVCQENEKPVEAKKLYHSVIKLADEKAEAAPALKQYRMLAQYQVAR